MADRPIIEIDVNADQFDSFLEKYRSYRESLDGQADKWSAVVDEVEALGNQFEAVAAAASSIGDATSSSKINQFFIVASKESKAIEKSSRETAGFWKATSRDLEKSAKSVASIARGNLGFGSFGGITGALLGTVGAIGGAAIGASSSLASKNLESRSLGLQVGDVETYEADFAKFGLGRGELQNVADAQADQRRWTPFLSAGLSPQQIQNLRPDQLLTEFDKLASGKYRQWQASGRPAGAMSQAYGFDSILSSSQLRAGASYSAEDFDAASAAYGKDSERARVSRSTADQASNNTAALRSAFEADINSIEAALSGLTPEIVKVTEKVTNWVTSFARSGDLKADIDKTVTAFDQLGASAGWLADHLNALFPKGTNPSGGPTVKGGSFAARALDYWSELNDAWNGRSHTDRSNQDTRFSWAWDRQSAPDSRFVADPNRDNHLSETDAKYGLKPGTLRAIEDIESSMGRHNVGPVLADGTTAKGPMQFTDSTAKRYHLDNPFDEASSIDAGGAMFADLLRQYHGDYRKAEAAYNWGSGNVDRDLSDNGKDWESHLPAQTKGYLAKMQAHGIDSDSDRVAMGKVIADAMRQHAPPPGPIDIKQPGLFYPPRQDMSNMGQGAPTLVNVTVSAPPGHNTNVSVGGLSK